MIRGYIEAVSHINDLSGLGQMIMVAMRRCETNTLGRVQALFTFCPLSASCRTTEVLLSNNGKSLQELTGKLI